MRLALLLHLTVFALRAQCIAAWVMPLQKHRTEPLHRSPKPSLTFPKCQENLNSSMKRSKKTTQSLPRTSSMKLDAIPPSLWWILGHNIVGAAPVPFIADATKNGGWLSRIDRPPWNPPDWIFGPVWTFLYTCMGIAVSRIFTSAKPASVKTPLLALWGVHFALNVSWAPTFFALKQLRPALVISCLMVATLLAVIPLFYSINASAGLLLLPYLAWISFATVLNAELCKRNPTKNGYNNAMLQAQILKLQQDAAAYADS